MLQCFFISGYLGKTGRVTQGQRGILVENLFINAAIVFQHEGVIRVGYQQDVENAPRHEVGKLGILEVKLVKFELAEHVFMDRLVIGKQK